MSNIIKLKLKLKLDNICIDSYNVLLQLNCLIHDHPENCSAQKYKFADWLLQSDRAYKDISNYLLGNRDYYDEHKEKMEAALEAAILVMSQ